MAWPLLLMAGVLEVAWAIMLKQADGFTRPWPTVGFLVAAAGSIVLLTIALRSLPVGTAYAAWTGIGALGTALVGIAVLGEEAGAARVASIALVAAGVGGLRVFSS
jgi:quaternary ammonium compound-resistance protein SugE